MTRVAEHVSSSAQVVRRRSWSSVGIAEVGIFGSLTRGLQSFNHQWDLEMIVMYATKVDVP